jgi:HD-GYP domain-containing protein (c-di-GMP phosphodiesterase class II)
MAEALRLAELMAALSLATDLGMGQPLEQALRTCLIALGLGERLGLRGEDLCDVYYVALLRFLGCTADAHEMAEMVGGDEIALRSAIAPVLGGKPGEFASQVIPKVGAGYGPIRRARLVARMVSGGRGRAREGVRAHCEMAESLAQRLGLPAGDDIPLSSRIVFVARDLEVLHRQGGNERAVAAARARRGEAYDPAVAEAFLAGPPELLTDAETTSPWEEVMSREPEPRPWVPEVRLDSVLGVFADFIDLKSPFTAGHSREVAALAAEAAAGEGQALRRAGLLHDLGRASVPNGIWDKPGALTEGEWERVRLHAYYSERILGRVKALKEFAIPAGMHHERMDGSGYHRGSSRSEIPAAARLLAAADAYQAMTQRRPHRPALAPQRAAYELESMAKSRRLDQEAVRSVLTAAGHRLRRARPEWAAGLSEREVGVLRLICRGGTKKEVAKLLSISPSTVDHHVRHIYEKAGVQTRAGATLFALEHDLLK